MARRTVAKRHRPSIWTYARRNVATTFDISDRAEAALTLVLLTVSAGVAGIAAVSAHEWSNRLADWNSLATFGITIFLVMQFLIITPCRMWRDAVWVANIEQLLDDIWDLHDQGVKLLNQHYEWMRETPEPERTQRAISIWIGGWRVAEVNWVQSCEAKLGDLYLLEARRFRNVVVVYPTLSGGLNDAHDHLRNMLLRRLEILQGVLNRHQPALLPG